MSFFRKLEKVQNLKKLELVLRMVDTFNSYYTHFFVSILNRFANLSSFSFNVTDYTLQEDLTRRISQPFALPLFFEFYSMANNIESIEILMPNLLFDDIKIDAAMNNLKSFTIGVTGNEEEEEERVFGFRNISRQMKKLLQGLFLIAPNLRYLVLDFIEVIDELTFSKRFILIEKFKQLEAFCSRYMIGKCSIETTITVGKTMQSLQKLNTVVLKFVKSDENLLLLKKYLYFYKSLKSIIFSFDDNNWIDKQDSINLFDV